MPVTERKERLRALLSGAGSPLHFSDHQIGRGRAFYDHACTLKVEGIVSKRVDAPYAPGNRGLWVKVKCLNREEFVVVGWTDPEGAVVADQSAREADQDRREVVAHGRYVTFQLAEVTVPRQMFAEILSLIARLRAPPAPA
jgi:ATP-dependent DNA ligase